ncbi:MAG: hypothetical protein HYS64_02830 [Rhodospirillales bacterium]|nr:hypothetical protein [Rhodospirillales bacterium]
MICISGSQALNAASSPVSRKSASLSRKRGENLLEPTGGVVGAGSS